MDIIFTGTPTKREIIIYLKNRKYSLINNIKLKRDIININKRDNLNFKDEIIRSPKLIRNIAFKFHISKNIQARLHERTNFYKIIDKRVYYQEIRKKFNTEIISVLFVVDLILQNISGSYTFTDCKFKVETKDYLKYNNENIMKFKQNTNEKKSLIEPSYYKIEYMENNTLHKLIDLNSNLSQNEHFKNFNQLKKEVFFFDEISDETYQNRKKLDVSGLFSLSKSSDPKLFDKKVVDKNLVNFFHSGNSSITSRRQDNLKKVTELSQKVLDLDSFSDKTVKQNKRIDFTFKKVKRHEEDDKIKNVDFYGESVPLKEINRNINKRIKKNIDNYDKELLRNTRLNSGYKNIIVRYTDKLITNHIKIEKIRKNKVRFLEQVNNQEIHNLELPVPIIKKSKFHNKNIGRNKHKEVVFIQNADLSSFNMEDDF